MEKQSNVKSDALAAMDQSLVSPLATKLAKAREGFIKFHEEVHRMERSNAVAEVDSYCDFARQQLLEAPPAHLTWNDLASVSDDKEGARLVEIAWQRMSAFAQDEINSGMRAAELMDGGYDHCPLDRVRFLAVRAMLRKEWSPSAGSESSLVDMLAQIQVVNEYWIQRHMRHLQSTFEKTTRLEQMARREGELLPPRISEAETIEQSATMIDRFNKLYTRTLRSLRDLKRMAPQIIVQNAGQVNVGDKQINVSQKPDSGHDCG